MTGFWQWLKELYRNVDVKDFFSFLSVLGSILLAATTVAFAIAVSFWMWIVVPFTVLLALYAWYRDTH